MIRNDPDKSEFTIAKISFASLDARSHHGCFGAATWQNGVPRGLPRRTCPEDLPLFLPKLLFKCFARAENKPLSRQSCDSAPICTATYMHAQWRLSWRHHWGRPCTADRMCASSPPFFWLVGYCTFSTPSCSNERTWARMSAREWNSMVTVMVTQNGAFAHAPCGRQAADKIFLHLAFDQAHGSPGISYFGKVSTNRKKQCMHQLIEDEGSSDGGCNRVRLRLHRVSCFRSSSPSVVVLTRVLVHLRSSSPSVVGLTI